MATATTMKKLLVLNTCANARNSEEVYHGLELLFDVAEHQPYLRDVERKQIYFVMGDYRHGDCGFLSALARYAVGDDEDDLLLPVTITHTAFAKSEASYDPDAEPIASS